MDFSSVPAERLFNQSGRSTNSETHKTAREIMAMTAVCACRVAWILIPTMVLFGLTACNNKSPTHSIAATIPVAAADKWIADNRGCKVSNVLRKPDETVEWSGLCKNGFAEGNGIVRWLMGSREIGRDDGEFHAGKMNGKGSRGFDNGDYYAGQFTNGVPSGIGLLRYSRGIRDRYTGEFRDGIPNGTGTLSLGDGSSYSGEFRNGEPIEHAVFSPPG
jgi:hypothetical protein